MHQSLVIKGPLAGSMSTVNSHNYGYGIIS